MYSYGISGIFRNSKWGSLQQKVGLNATEEGVLLKTKWDTLQLDTRKWLIYNKNPLSNIINILNMFIWFKKDSFSNITM